MVPTRHALKLYTSYSLSAVRNDALAIDRIDRGQEALVGLLELLAIALFHLVLDTTDIHLDGPNPLDDVLLGDRQGQPLDVQDDFLQVVEFGDALWDGQFF